MNMSYFHIFHSDILSTHCLGFLQPHLELAARRAELCLRFPQADRRILERPIRFHSFSKPELLIEELCISMEIQLNQGKNSESKI